MLLLLGKIFRPIFIIALWYFLENRIDFGEFEGVPISEFILEDVVALFVKSGFLVLITYVLGKWLIKGSDTKTYRELWGSFGIVTILIIIGVILILFSATHNF